MRTNIEIDDELMRSAMKLSGASTKKAVVEEALQLLVRMRRQADIRDLFGTIHWEGDHKAMRQRKGANDEWK